VQAAMSPDHLLIDPVADIIGTVFGASAKCPIPRKCEHCVWCCNDWNY
jgi:hypothetical protein